MCKVATALCAILVVLAAAGAGATGASATQLCPTNTSPCPSPYPGGTGFKATSNEIFVWVQGPVDLIECSSSFSFSNTFTTGFPNLKTSISAFTFGGCTDQGGGACTVTVANLAWGWEITAIVSGIGSAEFKGGGSPKILEVDCGGGTCEYEFQPGVSSSNQNLNGATPAAVLKISEVEFLEVGGAGCGEFVELEGVYSVAVNKGSGLFVTS